MSSRSVTVTEASRHFADLVNRTYNDGDTTVLLRSGEPVAMVVPVENANVTGREWLKSWREMPHLDPEDADDFATCIEEARTNLTLPDISWD